MHFRTWIVQRPVNASKTISAGQAGSRRNKVFDLARRCMVLSGCQNSRRTFPSLAASASSRGLGSECWPICGCPRLLLGHEHRGAPQVPRRGVSSPLGDDDERWSGQHSASNPSFSQAADIRDGGVGVMQPAWRFSESKRASPASSHAMMRRASGGCHNSDARRLERGNGRVSVV